MDSEPQSQNCDRGNHVARIMAVGTGQYRTTKPEPQGQNVEFKRIQNHAGMNFKGHEGVCRQELPEARREHVRGLQQAEGIKTGIRRGANAVRRREFEQSERLQEDGYCSGQRGRCGEELQWASMGSPGVDCITHGRGMRARSAMDMNMAYESRR